MGMRATIALTDTDGMTRLTSLQWSTMLHKSLAEAMVNTPEDKQVDAIRNAFAKTVEFEHATAVDTVEDERDVVEAGNGLFIHGPQGHRPKRLARQLKNNQIFDYHLDDNSIGARYDERNPEVVTFFWLNWNRSTWLEKVMSEDVKIADLAKGEFSPNYGD